MRVVLMSDTHVKSRAAALPEWVKAALEDADHVIHAGDFDSRPAYEEIADLAGELTAVAGNMDRALGLPEVATVELGCVRFVVTHGTAPTTAIASAYSMSSRTTSQRPSRPSGCRVTHTVFSTRKSTAIDCSIPGARPAPFRHRRRR